MYAWFCNRNANWIDSLEFITSCAASCGQSGLLEIKLYLQGKLFLWIYLSYEQKVLCWQEQMGGNMVVGCHDGETQDKKLTTCIKIRELLSILQRGNSTIIFLCWITLWLNFAKATKFPDGCLIFSLVTWDNLVGK